jgi:hypothetical protein
MQRSNNTSKFRTTSLSLLLTRCCRRKQQQRLLEAGHLVQPQRLSGCAARRQERCGFKALAANSLSVVETSLIFRLVTSGSYYAEYQPQTMAGILVMGVALGLQEGGKKIKKKAALVSWFCLSFNI